MNPFPLKSKFLGSLVGSALGDAIGELAFRFPRKGPLAKRVAEEPKLVYTDDTAMAIGLAESIIERRKIDPKHLGHTFRANFHREPWRGYASGPPTVFALVEQKGLSYGEAARTLFYGKGSFGNGAAMRIAPVGLFFHRAADLHEQACLSAQVTHAHPVGMDGAAVQAHAVALAVGLNPSQGFERGSFIEKLIPFCQTPEIRSKMTLVQELILRDVEPIAAARQLGQTVAVHESIPFALYCFLRHPQSFEDCLYCAVLNGGDRDTLGAMACAVSGAYLGMEAIPLAWRKKLENHTDIEQLANRLFQAYSAT